MASTLDRPLSIPKTEICDAKQTWRSELAVTSLSLASSCTAGIGIGLGWRIDEFAFLGVLGLGVFLAVQITLNSFWSSIVHGLITGYLAFYLANPWLDWTIDSLFDGSPTKAIVVVQAIHLLHGGMYCLFAGLWWASRKWFPHGLFTAPAIWLILESIYPAMFPMRQACLIADVTPLIQICSIFGVAGATLQVFAIASLIPLALLVFQPKASRQNCSHSIHLQFAIAIIICLTVINFSWGTYRSDQIQTSVANFDGDFLRVGVLQGDTEYAGSNFRFANRSRELAACDLILWPECSLGKYQRDLVDFSDETLVAKKSMGIGYQFRPLPEPESYLLGGGYSWSAAATPEGSSSPQSNFGLPQTPVVKQRFVSAFLLDPKEQLVGRHDKVELMAGGEYTPFADIIPGLDEWLADHPNEEPDETVRLSRGQNAQPIGEVKGMEVAALLCCEDMYPRLTRQMVNSGADLIVCLTNGMSFNSPIALEQHFNIGRFRAIENNRYFVRCGSYGISALIMPDGKVEDRLPCFVDQNLSVDIPLQKRSTTWFGWLGDTLTIASCIVLIGFAGCTFIRPNDRRRTTKSGSNRADTTKQTLPN
jgi:apolipoprotein N-acyltransferase